MIERCRSSSVGSQSRRAATERRNPSRRQRGIEAAVRFLVIVEIAERLPVLVADDEAGVVHLIEHPRRRVVVYNCLTATVDDIRSAAGFARRDATASGVDNGRLA